MKPKPLKPAAITAIEIARGRVAEAVKFLKAIKTPHRSALGCEIKHLLRTIENCDVAFAFAMRAAKEQ